MPCRFVTQDDDVRISAQSASREAGNVTVFEKGMFTPCKVCKENPRKGPDLAYPCGQDHAQARPGKAHVQQRDLRLLRRSRPLGPLLRDCRPHGQAQVGLPNALLQPLERARQHDPGALLLRPVPLLRLHLCPYVDGEGRHIVARRLATAHGKRRVQS